MIGETGATCSKFHILYCNFFVNWTIFAPCNRDATNPGDMCPVKNGIFFKTSWLGKYLIKYISNHSNQYNTVFQCTKHNNLSMTCLPAEKSSEVQKTYFLYKKHIFVNQIRQTVYLNQNTHQYDVITLRVYGWLSRITFLFQTSQIWRLMQPWHDACSSGLPY